MKNWWLYVLRLEQGKYYVGITSQTPEIRMQEHVDGVRGAYWTKQYKPIEIFYKEQIGAMEKADAEKIENVSVRKYMKQFGLNNVRGGDLTGNLTVSKTGEYSKFFGYIYMKRELDAAKFIYFLIFCMLVMFFLGRLSA